MQKYHQVIKAAYIKSSTVNYSKHTKMPNNVRKNSVQCGLPDVRLVKSHKDIYTSLFNTHYVCLVKEGYELSYRNIAILSDTVNHNPQLVEWCCNHYISLRQNITEAEKKTKELLHKMSGLNWSFQKPFIIYDKVYYADFYIANYKLIIEIDGDNHQEVKQIIKDNERTVYLNSFGINVIRISNEEIMSGEWALCSALLPYLRNKRNR